MLKIHWIKYYRYRDFLFETTDYTELAPNGFEILNSQVYRLYPTDDAEYPSEEELKKKNEPNNPRVQKLYDVIQEALTVHVHGLSFRERNAGPSIDDRMTSDGFNNQIGVDLNTGFVFGGFLFLLFYLLRHS